MKFDDKKTWVKCDYCRNDAQCRFFEVLTDTGAQVAVWMDEPTGWLMCPSHSGEVELACSPECALELSKPYEAELAALKDARKPEARLIVRRRQ